MTAVIRRRLTVTGQVQGVGFRPFVYRLAATRRLSGSVQNTPEGVRIEVQGPAAMVAEFEAALVDELPPLARIIRLDKADQEPANGEAGFEIIKSKAGRGHNVLISPDIATCPDCLADMADPNNRRHDYPFTNCTNCGPRYTITRSIPYDRPVTSMACFPMCPDCQAEYDDPLDRRFHAQPNACPACGPQVWLTDTQGQTLERGDAALTELAARLAKGDIAAVKGLGGFHLACDALNPEAVRVLRRRKHRPHKPLAVMVPDLDAARAMAEVTQAEAEWLTGARRPIVLLKRRASSPLCPEIAPDTDLVGLMLPYTPLHHVLLARVAKISNGPASKAPAALVMTSGNASGEPICLGNREALSRLGPMADCLLLHDRDILIRNDDSVLKVLPDGSTLFFRRARGFAPEPTFLEESGGPAFSPCVLGLGPELKCTLALTKQEAAFVSQYIGDMENLATLGFHQEILAHLKDILRVEPVLAVRDLHPDYMTSRVAEELAAQGLPVKALQHHFAHIHAVLAENRHLGPVLGLALDGTGLGEDQTIWGGEALYVDPKRLMHQRLARLAPFRLPGGEAAVREPWRIALGLVRQLGLDGPAPWLPEHEAEAGLVEQMLDKGINCPTTSSCGRLFDAVAALCGLCPTVTYEGQAAIRLEQAQDKSAQGIYPCPFRDAMDDGPGTLDGSALFTAAAMDLRSKVPVPVVARRFHAGLIQGLADMAEALCEAKNLSTVALSGGAMQNLTLAVELPKALAERGLTVLTHSLLPPNDGCISLGQAAWGRRSLLLGGA